MPIGAACAEKNPAEIPVNRFGSSTSPLPTAEDAIQEALRSIAEAIDLECSPEILQRLRLAASRLESVLARQPERRGARRALAEVKRLSDQPRADNVLPAPRGRRARSALARRRPEHCDSPRAGAGAPGRGDRFDGPPPRRDGLGKELFASQIHELSRRRRAERWSASTARPSPRR